MLRSDVVGSAALPIQPAQECARKDGPVVDTNDWYAWLNKMPSGPARLHGHVAPGDGTC